MRRRLKTDFDFELTKSPVIYCRSIKYLTRARRRMAVAVGEVEERDVPHSSSFPPERGKTTEQFVGKTIH